MKFTTAKKAVALTGAVAMLVSVAACGSDSGKSSQPAQDSDVKEITVWAWEPSLTQVAKDFEKETGIKVDLKNVGTNTKEYTQLDNAIEAGSGAPDVAQVEYYAVPQYAIKGNLLDITDKTSGYKDFYTPGPWASVQFAGKVYGLPMDSGPMAFFYNKEVFDKAGVDAEQIKTWDQYYDAAKKIHALGDNYYITSDTGDAGFHDLAGRRQAVPDLLRWFRSHRQPDRRQGRQDLHRLLAEAAGRGSARHQDRRLVRGLVQGHGRRHHRLPVHWRLDACQPC